MSALSLSVVIPAYNAEDWIEVCLSNLSLALERAGIEDAEVIVVDDGSSDGTAARALTVPDLAVRVLRQENRGRYQARRAGIEVAKGEQVLLLDTRVLIAPDALEFIAERWSTPDTSVWTAHVDIDVRGNSIGRFWRCIEEVAWRRYFKDQSTTSYGIDEFDYFPKGTTAFVAPRAILVEALNAFQPTVADWKSVNDDTAVLRYIAERSPINISPRYRVTYHARSSLLGFLRHANHRGTVLIDGYLRPGTRFTVPIALVLGLAPVAVIAAVRRPSAAAAAVGGGMGVAGVLSRALGARAGDALVLAVLSPAFGVVYLAGMYRGLALRVRFKRIARTR